MGRIAIQVPVFAVLMVLFAGSAFGGSYYVTSWHLQKRTQETGETSNRITFFISELGGSPVQADVVKTVEFVGPNGPISLQSLEFLTYEFLYGYLIPDTGQWYYDPGFMPDSAYSGTFNEDLEAGLYTLTITDTDDVVIFSETQYFKGVVELPQISSKSFRGFEDTSGNLIWQWDLPQDTGFWISPPDTSLRCWVIVYNGDSYIAEIYVRLPATASMVFIPGALMNMAKQKGDNFKIGLHIRTSDNQNRRYTENVPLSSLKKELRKVVVVPLN